jgi:outer membrane phospholipase A
LVLALWVLTGWGSGPARAGEEVPAAEEYPTLDSFFALYQPYLGNISAYEPIYFLVGTDPAKSKFQFSFRYRIFNSAGPLAAAYPWVNGVHFGYTQTSFWNLKSDSAPFEDTSYKPELFLLTSNLAGNGSGPRGLFVQTGFLHESNGQGADQSRSTNIFYLKPMLIFYRESSKLGVQFSPRFWLYVKNSEHNPDLADFRGYFELAAKLGKADGLVGEALVRWAREGSSVQLDMTYPLHRYVSDNLAIYLKVQYVNTLAESLVHYRERTEAFRLGVSFLR